MSAAVLVAIVAAVGNLLQGWDNATMAGAIIYIKKEFRWENEPTMEGLTVAMSLIGATLITPCSGGISDALGRRPMLIVSSVFYCVSGILMLWSPNVYLLFFARLLDGFAIGLSVTFVPIYISEMAPPEIRGLLSTLPQFTYSSGMFLSYTLVFCMSLMESLSWRSILGVLFAPSLFYLALTIFYLPESPRWLVGKGRMVEARRVLQRLRGREDVSSELALLAEGLEVGHETAIEEYVIGPRDQLLDEEEQSVEKEEIKLLGPEGISSMVAIPVSSQSSVVGAASHPGSLEKKISVVSSDPVVTLFDSIHEKLPRSGNQPKNEEWEPARREDYAPSGAVSESDEYLQSPLLSRQGTSSGNMIPPPSQGSGLKMSQGSFFQGGGNGEAGESTGIGSGWQLAWKWKEGEGPDGIKEGSFKRMYFHEDGVPRSGRGGDSAVSSPRGGGGGPLDREFIKTAALVSQSALCTKELMDQHPAGPAMIHPSAAATKGSQWNDLFEPGVKHALLVGMGIQIIQQFLGINGVLYYTPQILDQAGVGVLLSDMGISSESASLLISAVMTFLMLPCIVIAMKLMDVSGRRSLLLGTNPILTVTLVTLVTVRTLDVDSNVKAIVSTVSVIIYTSFFAMGFGPIPNILCAEIFPTRVRGICIAICALTFWICNIIVTYSLPLMLSSIGLAGVFSIYAVASIISWIFVFFKVPETKGMPLEVITEFFSVGAKQTVDANN